MIGEGATELVHIGQAVMAHGGKLDYFVDTVFNYPTLAECYKVAALAALNKFTSNDAVCIVAGRQALAVDRTSRYSTHRGNFVRADLVNHPHLAGRAKRIRSLPKYFFAKASICASAPFSVISTTSPRIAR